MLFNEPKLLKASTPPIPQARSSVSVLFNEPKLLKLSIASRNGLAGGVSVLFNEPKLLKRLSDGVARKFCKSFSALQRAEIAETFGGTQGEAEVKSFSALQRAEIAEILPYATFLPSCPPRFSALQRAEIAEILDVWKPKPALFEFQCSSTSRNC